MAVYGTKHPYAPEPKAYMLVREHPDIYIGGDNHYNAYAQYRGTTIVNNGCWQTTSDYAASKGFINTPGRVPQFSLKHALLREHALTGRKGMRLSPPFHLGEQEGTFPHDAVAR